MQELVKKTGGLVILADSFETSMFKQSFQKIFTRDDKGNLPMAFNGTLEVQVKIYILFKNKYSFLKRQQKN